METRKTAGRLQYVLAWVMAGLLTGCTTLRPLHDPGEPETLRAHLHQDDRVEVVTQDGQRLRFKVTAVGESALAGTAAKGKVVQLPFSQIAQIKVRRVSGMKTSLLVIGLLGAYVLIQVAAAPAAILGAGAP